jgi:hypothetical protein
MGEDELLALVHRRARSITARRAVRRVGPVVGALGVVGLLAVADRGSPSAVRTVDQGRAVEHDEAGAVDAPLSGPSSGSSSVAARPGEPADRRGAGVVDRPPGSPPADARAVPRSHLVTDPRGDDRPPNAGIDLLFGDLHYEPERDVLWFRIGVANLAEAPARVFYAFGFDYDGIRYSVSATRAEDGRSSVVVGGSECPRCVVRYETSTNIIHMSVPRQVLDARIADVSSKSLDASSPTGRPPSPPLRRGATFTRPGLYSAVGRDGPIAGSDMTEPNDDAASDARWVMP